MTFALKSNETAAESSPVAVGRAPTKVALALIFKRF